MRQGLRPICKASPLTAPGILAVLDEPMYAHEPSRVLRMEMTGREWEPRHHTALLAPADPEWRLAQAGMSGYSDYSIESVRLIIERIACDMRGVLAYDKDGVPAAAALAGVANGIGIFGVVVSSPAHRGQGYGRAGHVRGAQLVPRCGRVAAGIQVAAPNRPAVTLYGSLGLADGYDHSYRRPRIAA